MQLLQNILSSSLVMRQNKLECLYMQSIISLVTYLPFKPEWSKVRYSTLQILDEVVKMIARYKDASLFHPKKEKF